MKKEYIIKLGNMWVSNFDVHAKNIKLSEDQSNKRVTMSVGDAHKVADKIGGTVYELTLKEV